MPGQDARVGYRRTGNASRSFLCLVPASDEIRLIVDPRVLLAVTVPPDMPSLG